MESSRRAASTVAESPSRCCIEATATMTLAETPVLPNPVFEGSEKRVEIDFDWTHDSPASGLRALTRQQLDELMSLAGGFNCVVSKQQQVVAGCFQVPVMQL